MRNPSGERTWICKTLAFGFSLGLRIEIFLIRTMRVIGVWGPCKFEEVLTRMSTDYRVHFVEN